MYIVHTVSGSRIISYYLNCFFCGKNGDVIDTLKYNDSERYLQLNKLFLSDLICGRQGFIFRT